MIRQLVLCTLVFCITYTLTAQPWKMPWPNLEKENSRLTIGPEGRFLFYEDGEPFFYLGDTAWELFHKLDREEADYYLQNRSQKGFTVIQAVVLAQLGGLTRTNAYDALPLVDTDPAQPNEKYFEHVDYIVNKAEELGLFIGMLPTWGSHWKTTEGNIFTVENAEQFGQFLGNRYRDKPIIWILGGDAFVENEEEEAILNAMAKGLETGSGGQQLITFHPRGPGRSSDVFHETDWLDFNMVQSSHAAHGFDNGLFAEHDFGLQPAKPTLDGEPRYEDIIVGFYYRGNNQLDRFTDYDARTAAYWSLLAGACGHTYGNNNIWQMWAPGEANVIGANIPWYEAVDHPGAFNMMYLRRLFESRPFHLLRPAQDILVDAPQQGQDKVRAALATDGSFAFVYSPTGQPFTIKTEALAERHLSEYWYNPRYGSAFLIHEGGNEAIKTYTPPTQGIGNDWVLVLDVQSKGFGVPGALGE